MLSKTILSTVRRTCGANGGALSQAMRLYHEDHQFKPPTMDEVPVPEGSWEEYHKKQQAKYNMHLALGVGFAIFSVAVAKSSGLFFFNLSRPDRPADISSYE